MVSLTKTNMEVKNVNGKTKALLLAAVTIGLIASAIYIAPTLAYMNGDTDQTRDRDRDRIKDQDCLFNCGQDRNQTRTQLRLQTCLQSLGPAMQYQYQYRYQHMLSP